MKDVYDMLNDVEIDLNEFDDTPLSEPQIKKVNNRLKKLCVKKKTGSQKTAIWVGRAAILVLGCLVFGGGVYAATQYRKNVKDDFRIKSEDATVVSEEDNKVTMEIHDDITGGMVTFDVVSGGKASAKIVNISGESESFIKVGIEFNFDEDVDLTELKSSIEEEAMQGGGWNSNTDTKGINLKAMLDGREVMSWGNEYRFDGQNLFLDLFMGNSFEDNIKAIEEYNKTSGVKPLTANSTDEEIDARFEAIQQYLENPDYTSGTIEIDIEFTEELGGVYKFTTDIDDYVVEEDKEYITIEPIKGELDIYGMKEMMTVDSYTIGATGFKISGRYEDNTDWNDYCAQCEEAGIEACGNLTVRAWDDLGNTYLMIMTNNDDGTYSADLYDNAVGLQRFSKEDGIAYKSEWADDMTQLSFAIQKRVGIQDASGNDEYIAELVSETRTIDIPQN